MMGKHMAEPFIICDNLVKIYKIADLEVVALQGLDLVVERGEMMGIVGASGSGKTTLLNILGGLDRPSAGKVYVGGLDLLKLSDRGLTQYRRKHVGFIWQQVSRNLVPYLTAQENVELPMIYGRVPGSDRKRRATEILEIVGLGGRITHRPAELSGGERQRVALARALSNNPEIILADEPTGNLDSKSGAEIVELFERLHQEGKTLIIVTHDERIAAHCKRVIHLLDGRIDSDTLN